MLKNRNLFWSYVGWEVWNSQNLMRSSAFKMSSWTLHVPEGGSVMSFYRWVYGMQKEPISLNEATLLVVYYTINFHNSTKNPFVLKLRMDQTYSTELCDMHFNNWILKNEKKEKCVFILGIILCPLLTRQNYLQKKLKSYFLTWGSQSSELSKNSRYLKKINVNLK